MGNAAKTLCNKRGEGCTGQGRKRRKKGREIYKVCHWEELDPRPLLALRSSAVPFTSFHGSHSKKQTKCSLSSKAENTAFVSFPLCSGLSLYETTLPHHQMGALTTPTPPAPASEPPRPRAHHPAWGEFSLRSWGLESSVEIGDKKETRALGDCAKGNLHF